MSDIPSADSPIETRQRLLEAAGEVFADVGFQRATIRDICQKAGANVAAVNYHFRDKEGLYVEVVRYAEACSLQRHPDAPAEAAAAPPEVRLRMFIGAFLQRAIGQDRLAWHGKMIAKEMSEPTAVLDKIVANEIRPRATMLEGILRELLGPNAPQSQIEACARSVVSQCIFYHLCRPVIDRLHPNQKYEPDDVKALADHIATFSLHAVRGLAADRAKEKR
ncbi:CerR family C-terminal domain-containing protein [soil metagenome]